MASLPSRILVPVKGVRVDEEVLELACYLARRNRATVYVVHVIEVKRSLPVEIDLPDQVEAGDRLLDRAEEVARRFRQDVKVEVLQARDAGTAIVEEAENRSIDLIVMGLSYAKRFDQFHLGSTTMYVLKNAACRVLVHREQMP